MNGHGLTNHVEHFDLPAASTLEMTLTSGQFDASLFALANGGDFTEESEGYKIPVTEELYVASDVVTLSDAAPTDISINGMKLVTTTPAADDEYQVTTGSSSTTITFNSGAFADGDPVEVNYYVVKTGASSLNVKNDRAAIGEAVLRWPVYNGGENVSAATFNGATVMGYIVMKVYRCRVTQVPGFDTSYKSAATNAVTLSTMDPANAVGANGNAYTITYYPNDEVEG